MSYRSFKRVLGETSLERKCRFIFGGGILVLVTFSFYWYGQKTERLVIEQTGAPVESASENAKVRKRRGPGVGNLIEDGPAMGKGGVVAGHVPVVAGRGCLQRRSVSLRALQI